MATPCAGTAPASSPERKVDGVATTLLSITTDLTALRSMERQVADAVARDDLTGLASTAALLEFCDQRLAAADADARLSLIVVDLDRFGQVRQTTSQDGADELLRLVGRLLVAASPHQALVARTRDQEFVVASMFAAATASDDAVVVADRLLAVTHDADRRGRSDLLTASIGVIVADDPSVSPRTMLEDARLAVGAAKELGRDRVVVFDRQYRRAASDRRAMLDAIRRALDDGAFRVLYQPEVDLTDGHIIGVEALVRWARPGHGLLPPAEFIELAERNGLIAELGAQVLDQALSQLAAWTKAGADLIVAVNVSAQQLVSEHFVATVDEAIRGHGVDPRRVRLELTETSLLVDPTVAARTLAALRDLGTQIALDDFGAGYASIGYLRTLPLDVLKIDQSFVAGLPEAEDDLAIVRFVVGLAETLGLEVTAEGIERLEQAEALLALGCHHGQGFLYERPVPAEVIAGHLELPGALAG